MRQQGVPAIESLTTDFPDEFQDNPFPESVFHVEREELSEFQEIITYLTEQKYPEGLNREEKSVFQSKEPLTHSFKGYSSRRGRMTLSEDAWSGEKHHIRYNETIGSLILMLLLNIEIFNVH